MNWTLIAALIAAVVVVLVIGLVIARRKPAGPRAVEEIASLRVQENQDVLTTLPSLRDRLANTRNSLSLSAIFSRTSIDQSVWDDLEERLIRGDVGMKTTLSLTDSLRERAKVESFTSGEQIHEALSLSLRKQLGDRDRDLTFVEGHPNVWLFVGVNGVGKTTTIGKLAKQQTATGRSVIMAAGDTFRAAAGEQLETWAQRAGVEVVRGQEGGDPAAVIFDAIERASARNIDLVLADTAGRLQNKANLMNELDKIRRVASREPALLTEVLLVLDATTGQNGLTQAKEFLETAGVTGVVLTKLDGSAKGGIALAIEAELGIPVKLVGIGETISDLVAFDPDAYVGALVGE